MIRISNRLFPILLLVLVCMSQRLNPAGSLENPSAVQEEERNKQQALYQWVVATKQTNKEQAKNLAREMYKVSKVLRDTAGMMDALIEWSDILTDLGEYDSASALVNQLLAISVKTSDSLRLASGFRNLGKINFYIAGPSEAVNYYQQSLEICKKSGESYGLAQSLNGVATCRFSMADYETAIGTYLELFRLCEKEGYEQILAKGYINIGKAYDELKDFEKAASFYRKSIRITEKLNLMDLLAKAYNNLANIYFEKPDYDSSWLLFIKAIELNELTGSQLGLPLAYNNLGNICVERKQYQQALEYFDLAGKQYLQGQDSLGFLIAFKNKGSAYLRQGLYASALEVLEQCLAIANRMESTYHKLEIYSELYRTYYYLGDFKKAFDNLLEFKTLSDTIFGLEKNKAISDLEIKYKTEHYLAENLALQNQNLEKDLTIKRKTIQRNAYLYTGTSGIGVLLLIILIYIQRARRKRIVQQHRIAQLQEEKKLLAARSIVEGQEEERKRVATELHDGLGVLLSSAKMQFTTLKNKIPEHETLIQNTSKLLEQAAQDVRRISHNMMPGLLTKYGFFEAVEDLFEQVEDGGQIQARVTIVGETQRFPENMEIMLYRIIQEMLNNTLKHSGAERVDLKMIFTPDKLVTEYTDNGKGFDPAEVLNSKSIGLTSIRSRVKYLNGDLLLESEPDRGVVYKFEIPLN